MPLLFSYGTLQQEAVQMATFGRRLSGAPDALLGFARATQHVADPAFVAASGRAEHATVKRTGRMADQVTGTAFEVTEAELARADAYEPAEYARVRAVLTSGREAWVYARAGRDAPAFDSETTFTCG